MNGSGATVIDGSTKSSRLGGKEENLGSKTAKKKQQSPFKSFKNTLLLRGHKHRKPNVDDAKLELDPPKLRRDQMQKNTNAQKPISKPVQRFSAQRVTLFKYEHVRVVSCNVASQRSGSSSSASTATSQSSVLRHVSSRDGVGRSNIKRETCLMSNDWLEIYQIITHNPKAPPQKMNYLCLGRKGNIVHPILPKLQITRLDTLQFQVSILLFNPERYWDIEFLPYAGQAQLDENIARCFENVVSSICSYRSEKLLASNDSAAELLTELKIATQSDDSDLEYLLEDSDASSSDSEIASSHSSTKEIQINEAFKKALHNITLCDISSGMPGANKKRFSSYQTRSLPSRTIREPSLLRSNSVPKRLVSDSSDFLNLRPFRRTWMDISFDDLENE